MLGGEDMIILSSQDESSLSSNGSSNIIDLSLLGYIVGERNVFLGQMHLGNIYLSSVYQLFSKSPFSSGSQMGSAKGNCEPLSKRNIYYFLFPK